jgi:hypothetical protein
MFSERTGQARLGYRPSKKCISRSSACHRSVIRPATFAKHGGWLRRDHLISLAQKMLNKRHFA